MISARTPPTDPQAEAFCGDDTKTTDSKTDDCAPTVMRVCGANIFDPLCTNHATEQLAFCRDDTKTSPTKANDCANTVNLACNANIFDMICTTATPMQEAAFCRDDSKTTATKANDCADTITRVCGANIYDTLCNGDPQYTNQRDAIRLQCIADGRGETVCDMEALMARCTGNPFTQECEADYGDLRRSTCASEINESRCTGTVALVCNADKFDTYCIGANAYKNAQIGDCADATATLATCNMFFTGNLAGCLQDPFSVACHTEPTFTDRASVRTSRFNYCKTDQTSDARCVGYTTCNVSATFAPITCGTDFNPVRMMFCGTTLNAFDPLCITNNLIDTNAQMAFCRITQNAFDGRCVGGLADATAQLAFCKLDTSDPFGTDCGGMAFKEARVEFCIAKPTTIACDTDLHNEDLVYNANPCEGLSTPECTVEVADLPTYPATPNATTTNEFLAITATTASTLTQGLVPTTLYITESTTNGMAFFTENSAYYAGILAGTDLGAPIVETTTTALKWQGDFRAVAGIAEAVVGADNGDDFELDITFDGDEGTMKTFFNVGGTGFYYSIDGTFDDKGVISGDILFGTIVGVRENRQIVTDHENYSPGTLTGLIGQNGAVGAFISGHETLVAGSSAISYSGGFFATPPAPPPPPDPCIEAGDCVEFADWTASFASGGDNESTTSPLRESGFTNAERGTSDYIRLDGDNKIVTSAGTFTPSILRLNETVNQDGYESGFAYVNISITGFVGQTYVGMLPTTNLGAPLINTDKNATWTGRLAGQTGFATPPLDIGSFSLKITFGGTSSEAGSVGTITTLDGDGDPGFTSVNGGEGDANGIRFIGDFNAAGVMWGSVNLHGADADNGTFNGLIGVKGAIGVFEGAISSYSYAGGFAVAPPTN